MDEMQIVRRYRERVPVDIIGLIRELGIEYREEPMEAGASGRIDFDGFLCTITVNANEGPQRKRFTAAHELGHYLMHRDLIENRGHLDRLFGPPGLDNPEAPLSPRHEVQANQFAADLLMPGHVIRQRYDLDQDNVRQLADLMRVSPAAMKIRLQSLGLRAPEAA